MFPSIPCLLGFISTCVEMYVDNIEFNIVCSCPTPNLCRPVVEERGRDGAQDDGQPEGPRERRPHRQEPARRLGLIPHPPTHLYDDGVKKEPTPNSIGRGEKKSVIKDGTKNTLTRVPSIDLAMQRGLLPPSISFSIPKFSI